MKVAITNAVLSNTGDAAIFRGIQESLLEAGVCENEEITVFDSDAQGTAGIYSDVTVLQQLTLAPPRTRLKIRRSLQRVRTRIVRAIVRHPNTAKALLLRGLVKHTQFAKAYDAMRRSDVVISTGGTYMVDHYDYAPKVLELEIARALGKPIYLWTQSMGPFQSARSSATIKRLDGRIAAAFFRDARSMNAWRDINRLPEDFAVVPDVAFAMHHSRGPRGARKDGKTRVAISVREWSKGGVDSESFSATDYELHMRQMASTLLNQGREVIALSTCQGLERYAIDDSKYARRVFSGLPVNIDASHRTPEQLLAELSKVDLVITTRMHLAILSLMAGTPTIAIGYEFKTMELFRGFDLGRNAIEIENINDPWIRDCLDRFADDPSSFVLSDESLAVLKREASEPALRLRYLTDRLQ